MDGVRTTGSEERCLELRRTRPPVDAVSASDMMPASSSRSEPLGDSMGIIHLDDAMPPPTPPAPGNVKSV